MGLDVPTLDDRTYDEILEDLRKRIPVHNDDWTDHNAHDPGITILELLAWLAESYGYQLDQVTDEHRLKYLDLVGEQPNPPQTATTDVWIDATAGLDGRRLAPGTPFAVETADGDRSQFETTDDVVLTSVDLAAVIAEHDRGRTNHTVDNEQAGRHYHAFGRTAGPDSALYLGFDGDPFAATERFDLHVDYHDANLSAPAHHGDEESLFEPSIVVHWQHCTNPQRWYRDDAWVDVPVHRDETMHFYQGGRVILGRPEGWDHDPALILDREEPLYWLRCVPRASSEMDRATRWTGEAVSDSAAVEPATRYEVPPRIDAIRPNVVPVAHRERIDSVNLTREAGGEETTAEPNQRFEFDRAPVQAAAVFVGYEHWERVTDFTASSPDDRHYVLERADGIIRFGDGRRGSIPPPGRSVVAKGVVYGGGPKGNVGQSTTWQLLDDDLRNIAVDPLAPPRGGQDAETIDEALSRTIKERSVPYRAVTAEDYREIALRTPGLRFGRAAAVVADDGVRVVVIPHTPPDRRPVPTRGFLAAVETHLRSHALLTDRVWVVPPTYVNVAVDAEVRIADGYTAEGRRQQAVKAMTHFLDPLEGFEGDGWPFGRPVYRSECYELLDGVEGIKSVVDVDVTTSGPTTFAESGTALPVAADVEIQIRSNGDRCGRDRT